MTNKTAGKSFCHMATRTGAWRVQQAPGVDERRCAIPPHSLSLFKISKFPSIFPSSPSTMRKTSKNSLMSIPSFPSTSIICRIASGSLMNCCSGSRSFKILVWVSVIENYWVLLNFVLHRHFKRKNGVDWTQASSKRWHSPGSRVWTPVGKWCRRRFHRKSWKSFPVRFGWRT